MLKKNLLLVGALSLLNLHLSAADSIFTSDFSGTEDWNFDSKVDPNSQIGGTNQFTYTGAATDGNAYLTKDITISDTTTSETGTLVLSGSLDLSHLDFQPGSGDHAQRNLISIGTISGNKSGFAGGSLFNFSIGGQNVAGEYSITQGMAIRFWGGGGEAFTNVSPAGVMDFETTITVSGDDLAGWVIAAETTLTNTSAGTMVMSSSYSRTDTGFNGIQDINRIQVGFNGGTYGIDTGEYIIMDDISLSMIPEPSTYGILSAFTVFAFVCGQRRRR